jgi:tetratricopeptide (TPR) repeat protein
MWGMIALGLLILFLFVGYQAAMKARGPSISIANTRDTHNDSDSTISAIPPLSDTAQRPIQDQQTTASDSHPSNTDATHKLLRSAVDQHQYETAIEYGKQIYDSGKAGPDDLLIIAQSYFLIGNCPNTLTWIDRANEAFHAASREAGESLQRMKRRCRSGLHNSPITLTAGQCEHMGRLLNHYNTLTQADRERLPKLETEAAQIKFGQAYVNLGELYFGFGDYEHAITAIQCGLEKGQVVHLDDAYVYLGRSLVAIDNIDEARKAFAKLKEVPNISPRVLRLWELYAETLQ